MECPETHKTSLTNIIFMTICLSIVCRTQSVAELIMHTQGHASFAPYANGVKETAGLRPGYRAEFASQVDFFRNGRFVITGLVGNMTIISRSDSSIFNLDKIRYTLSPGFRYEFKTWYVKGVYYHESLYSISRAEEIGGAYWQNSIRLGAGTKGSTFLYLPEKYLSGTEPHGRAFDAQCSVGAYLHGSESIWVAKNHTYRFEMLALLRYHAGSVRNWIVSFSLNQHLRLKADNTSENKSVVTINLFRRGSNNRSGGDIRSGIGNRYGGDNRNGGDKLFGIYYVYTVYDAYAENNEDRLGALGLRVIY